MARVRIELIPEGFAELLSSPEVTADLTERAERIAAAAGDGMEVTVWHGNYGGGRTIATIRTATPAAMEAEATDRALTRAIDAGR